MIWLPFIASILAGAIASIAGFGIGSILTPMLTNGIDMKLAVAAVSIPHFIATALRGWMLRAHINKKVLLQFGSFSAIGGLLGALLHDRATDPNLMYLFAALLIFVGISGLTGLAQRMNISPAWSPLAGIASGAFGGLVGNQGGLRSAALTGLSLEKEEFVATATAIGVIVDLARMPVYVFSQRESLLNLWFLIALLSVGCVIGTLAGKAVLLRLPERTFRITVYLLILALGLYTLISAAR
jgi:uncharacterized membrane protein YfcA